MKSTDTYADSATPKNAPSNQHDSGEAASSVGILQRCALLAIRGYQVTLSPWIGRQCRFYPTCSHYAAQAISQHGFVPGLSLSVKRICKCHPFHPGGVDLVPDPSSRNSAKHANQH